jgi:hypothetical protein
MGPHIALLEITIYMILPNYAPSGASDSARRWTTVLACAWGLVSAFVFFNSLLVTHESRSCFASAIVLAIVWATLDRKRWGRLALLGMSKTILVLFAVFAAFSTVSVGAATLAVSVLRGASTLPYLAVCLAIASRLWLGRPAVAVEFERGKRPALTGSQSVIALTLVVFWALSFVDLPATRLAARPGARLPSAAWQAEQPYASIASRTARSAAAASSR